MRNFARLSAVAVLLASGAALAQTAPTAQIDPARLSQHVQTLGSDAFEGRAPATAGETKTVDYKAEKAGKITFKCCHVCGLGHGGMKGSITVK